MAKIRLVRVDSRLGHGKTIREILANYDLNKVIFANDRIFDDEIHKKIERLTVPAGVEVNFLKVADVKDFLDQKTGEYFVLVENTSDLESLVDEKIQIEEVNLGIINLAIGKRILTEMVAADDCDLNIFRKLYDLGIETYIRKEITDPKIPIKDFL